MSKILRTAERCRDCGGQIAAGERARGSVGQWRHYDPAGCTAARLARAALATERQVAYALDLQRQHWTPAVLGGQRYDREQLAALSREAISAVIDALLAERQLQEG